MDKNIVNQLIQHTLSGDIKWRHNSSMLDNRRWETTFPEGVTGQARCHITYFVSKKMFEAISAIDGSKAEFKSKNLYRAIQTRDLVRKSNVAATCEFRLMESLEEMKKLAKGRR